MKKKMSLVDRGLTLIFVSLVITVLGIIAMASPALGVSLLIVGVALAFRRRLGRVMVGAILLLPGIALAVAALISAGQWERADENDYSAWVADVRRNPCEPREALLIVAAFFLACGGGMMVSEKIAKRKEAAFS